MAVANGLPVTGVVSGSNAEAADFMGPYPAPVLAATQSPERLFLLVLFELSTGIVSPAPGSKALGFGPDVGGQGGARLLHAASFPGLIGGEWFVYDSAGGAIRVYDVERPG